MKTERFTEYNADKSLTLPAENRNSLWQKNGNILIVDDNRGVLTALQLLLKPYFEGIITLPSPVTLPSVLRERSWQVVLLDMNFTSGINTGNEGLYWLHKIKKQCPTLPVVLFTAYADIDLAVRGIKEGATDFVVKPWNNQKLVETLLNAVSASETKSPANGPNAGRTAESSHLFADTRNMYWGNSPAMQQLRLLVEKWPLPMPISLLRARTVPVKRCWHAKFTPFHRATGRRW